MTKFKKRKEEQLLQLQNGTDKINLTVIAAPNSKNISTISERFSKIFRKTKKKILNEEIKNNVEGMYLT